MIDPEKEKELLEAIKVIDKAISMENNTRAFYTRSAVNVESFEGKKILSWLADFETGHANRLREKRNKILEENKLEIKLDEKPADMSVLSEAAGSDLIEPKLSDTEIIMQAIEFETKARAYYERKARHTTDPEIRDLLLELMRDEGRHIEILADQHNHMEVKRIWKSLDDVIK